MPGLFFADDMVLLATDEERLQRLLDIAVTFGDSRKLEFNGKKSKIMTNWREPRGGSGR